MRYVAYYRVSTQEQGRSGLGIDAQVSAVTAHVRSRGAELVCSFTEVESGKHADRPQLAMAIRAAIKSKAVLLIAKLDRLARNVHFVSALIREPGLEIEACDMPAANRMVMHIMASIAEGEAEAISTRTKAAMKEAALRGKKFGLAHEANASRAKEISSMGNAVNHQKSRHYVARTGPIIEDLRRRGYSFQQIADEFTARAQPFARKRHGILRPIWSLQSVHHILKQYRFVGPYAYEAACLADEPHRKSQTSISEEIDVATREIVSLPSRKRSFRPLPRAKVADRNA